MRRHLAFRALLVLVPGQVIASSLPSGREATAIAAWAEPAIGATPRPRSFGWPIAHATLTSAFGYRADPLGAGLERHPGVDLAGHYGAPVFASADGLVVQAGMASGYGMIVAIDHGGGMTTRYAHLSELLVHAGSRVLRGQCIGRIGSTGRSTGPHLHYEVRIHGAAIDPLAWLSGDRFVDSPADDLAVPVFVSAFAAISTTGGDGRASLLPTGREATSPPL